MRLYSLFLFIAVFSFTFLSSDTALAQTPAAGIGLSPATIEEAVEQGVVYDHEVKVTNLSNTEQTYYFFTRDIVGVEAGGVPIFAGENTERTGFELTDWITLGVEEMTIPAGGEGVVPITVSVPDNASPGSHFGGVFTSIEPPRIRSIGAAVGYEVATILSMRVAGDVIENAQIRSFATENYLYGSSEVNFNARVENKGNVLVRPLGPLEINNMFGKRVALLTFNESQAGVFPLSTRDFQIKWTDEGPGFGRYEAVLSLVYGAPGAQSTISSIATFWILPMDIIMPAVGALIVLLLVVFVAIKLYVRRKLTQVTGRSRRLASRRSSGGFPLFLVIILVMLMVTALFLVILLALFA